VTFTATVFGAKPTGTVTFNDGASAIGPCTARPLSNGVATCTTSTLGVGTHTIKAVYNGDANNATSTSRVLEQSGVASVDNQFKLASVKLKANGTVSFSVTLPGRGAIDVAETAVTAKNGKHAASRVTFGGRRVSATRAGKLSVRVVPTARGKRAIAQSHRLHRALSITLSVTYTPTGGKARTQTKQLRLKP
jgi:hypothetical protein